jgi:hypothetical protein
MIGFMENNKDDANDGGAGGGGGGGGGDHDDDDDDDDDIQEILILLHPIHNHNRSLCTQLVDIPDSTGLQRILPVSDVWRHLILSHL